jgi:hypothetical protein
MADNVDNKNKSFAERFAKKSTPDSAGSGGPASGGSSFSDKYKKKSPMETHTLANKEDISNTSSSKADLVYLVKGIDDGKNAWYYVLVERLKLSLFLKALNDDIIHLENYGEILYSAYGDEPPQEITDLLKKEYGIK